MARRSLVAGVNALIRAEEALRPPEHRVVEDPLAAALGETHRLVGLIRGARRWIPPLDRQLDELCTAHVVRHRSVDAQVVRSLDDGATQVVTLGAGYDSRPFRFARGGVRWFEVDRQVVLERKEELLRAAGHAPAATPVPLDLQRASLASALASAGLDPAAPTLFVVEGLIHYLSHQEVGDLLDTVVAGSGARWLVLTAIEPAMVQRAGSTFRWLVRLVREIPETFFHPEDLGALVDARGLGGFESWRYPEQVEAFAPAARGRPVGVSQYVARARR